MLLTRQNVIHYLMHAGLLSAQDVVGDDLCVSEQTHRNRAYKVTVGGQPGFFVKQAQDWHAGNGQQSTLMREAECYELAAEAPRLRDMLPSFHRFDRGHQILVVGLVDPSESLSAHYFRTRQFPVELATQVGRQLAALHMELGKAARFGGKQRAFGAHPPWILRPERLDRFASREQSLAQAKVVSIVQGLAAVLDKLKALAQGWRVNGIMHGDLKFANCLCVEPGSATQGVAIRFVDFEMADAGNIAWDVAGLLQSYLALWIQSTRLQPGISPAEVAASAQLPIEMMQPSLRALWRAYAAGLDVGAGAAAALLRQSVEYAGARLVQTAFEYMDERPQLTGHMVLLLQLSANFLAEPEAAADEVLGLR